MLKKSKEIFVNMIFKSYQQKVTFKILNHLFSRRYFEVYMIKIIYKQFSQKN